MWVGLGLVCLRFEAPPLLHVDDWSGAPALIRKLLAVPLPLPIVSHRASNSSRHSIPMPHGIAPWMVSRAARYPTRHGIAPHARGCAVVVARTKSAHHTVAPQAPDELRAVREGLRGWWARYKLGAAEHLGEWLHDAGAAAAAHAAAQVYGIG